VYKHFTSNTGNRGRQTLYWNYGEGNNWRRERGGGSKNSRSGSSRDQRRQFPELRIAPLRQAPAKAPFEFHHCYVSLEDFEAEKSAAEREFPSSGSLADM